MLFVIFLTLQLSPNFWWIEFITIIIIIDLFIIFY